MTEQRTYRGRSLPERREERRVAVLEAGLECLHEHGLAGISVRTVCARARLTDRYFYENFLNLDALLVALVDTICDELVEAAVIMTAERPSGLPEQVRGGLDAVFSVILVDPRKATVLLAARAYLPMHTRLHRRLLDYATMLAAAVADERPPPVAPDALRSTALFLIGGALELISAKLSGLIDLGERELVEQCVDLIVGELLGRR